MRTGRILAWHAGVRMLTGFVLTLMVGVAGAQAAAIGPAGPPEAQAWLNRIHEAALRENYAGTFIYQRGGTVHSSRIVHSAERGNEFEQIETLDGRPRKMYRHNDEIYTLIPDQHLCVVDKQENKDAFPGLLAASSEQVMRVYAPRMLGEDRVAGVSAQVIELQPKDRYRYAYRLWADEKTGLLLRTQTLDAQGDVLEQIAFSQLTIGIPSIRSTVLGGMRALSGWKVIRSPVAPANVEAQGWRIHPDLPGFRIIRELSRPMQARNPAAPPVDVQQVVFSDGLSAVSVFIEPADNSDRKEGSASDGATHILVQRLGAFWVTLLGEVPAATLQRFASSIDFTPLR